MAADRTGKLPVDICMIEAGVRSSLVTFEQMLPQGSLILKSREFIHSSAAARACLQQLRGDGVEIILSLSGKFSGTFSLALDSRGAQQLVTALTGKAATMPIFNEMDRSALKEAGNIVASAFLGAIESLCGSGGLPGLPDLYMGSPCHDKDSVVGEDGHMYALPMTLVSARADARGGIFITLYGDDSALPFPTGIKKEG